MDKAKTFKEVQVGDTLYELRPKDSIKAVKVISITKKGEKTAMVEVESTWARKVELEKSLYTDGWRFWFTEKEKAFEYVKSQIEGLERAYQRDMKQWNEVLTQFDIV